MARNVLGIDVGGSSIKAGLVDVDSGVVTGGLISAHTPQPSTPKAMMPALASLAARLPGAAGGVGIAVLQLCRTVENVTTFGTASPAKHDVLRDNGCTYPIDYHTVDYAAEVRRLTQGRGVDVALDPLGGRDTLKAYRLLRAGGRVVVYGFANLQGRRRNLLRVIGQVLRVPRFSPLQMMAANRGLIGVNLGHLSDRTDLLHAEMLELLALFEQGKIAPAIDSVLPFERAAEGYARIASGSNVGKIILTP